MYIQMQKNEQAFKEHLQSPFSTICPVPEVSQRKRNQTFSLRYSMFAAVSQESEDELGYNHINKKV